MIYSLNWMSNYSSFWNYWKKKKKKTEKGIGTCN